MIDVRDIRGWVLAARINGKWGLNPDNRIAEVVYVVGVRIMEICGKWPFPEAPKPPQSPSADFILSFQYGERVDPAFGYGKLAYQYCNRYTQDNAHIWPRIGQERAQMGTAGADGDDLF